MKSPLFALFVSKCCLLLSCECALAVDRTWDGGDILNTNWNDADNWNPNGAPNSGDRLIFPSGVSGANLLTNNAYGAGSFFLGLNFTGSGYQVNGNAFNLGTAGISMDVSGTGSVTLNSPVGCAGLQTWSAGASDTLLLNGSVSLNGFQLNFGGLGVLDFEGGIIGSGNGLLITMTAGGNGGVRLGDAAGGTLGYTGDTKVAEGVLEVNGVLTESQIEVEAGGVLGGNGSTQQVRLIGGTLQPGRVAGGTSDQTARLTINDGLLCDSASTCHFNLAGSVAGTTHDQLVVNGLVELGNVSLSLNLASGYIPALGTEFLLIDNDGASDATGNFAGLPEGSLFDDSSGVVKFLITYRSTANDVKVTVVQINPTGITKTWDGGDPANTNWSDADNWNLNAAITQGDDLLFPAGPVSVDRLMAQDLAPMSSFHHLTFQSGGYSISGNELVLSGNLTTTHVTGTTTLGVPITLSAENTTWTIANGSAVDDLVLDNEMLSGISTETFSKTGEGQMSVRGFFSVPLVQIFDGTLALEDGGDADIELNGNKAIVKASGSFFSNSITALAGGGVLAPGIGLGKLAVRNLSLNSVSHFAVELQSATTDGVTYDQLIVSNDIQLGGANLALALLGGFAGTAGDHFKILANSGTKLINGTFAGLPEGQIFTAGGRTFHITYVGGDGNDVVLTVVVQATGVEKRWSGLGANPNWSTASNWQGGVAPVAGDRLRFPTGATQFVNQNDFPAGTSFDSLMIETANYQLGGNEVMLNSGITMTHGTTAEAILSLDLKLALAQNFAINGGCRFIGALILNEVSLTCTQSTAASVTSVAGAITGDGELRKAGTGRMILSGSNSYTARTVVAEGTLEVQTSGALGTAVGSVEVLQGATLELKNSVPVQIPAKVLLLRGTLRTSGTSTGHSWAGNLSYGGGQGMVLTETPLEILGSVARGELVKIGASILQLSGPQASGKGSFPAHLKVQEGTVVVNGSTSGILNSTVTVGDGVGIDTLRLEKSDQMGFSSTLVLLGGVVDLNNKDLLVDTFISAAGSVTNGGAGTLTVKESLTTRASATPTAINANLVCEDPMDWNIEEGAAANDLICQGSVSGVGGGSNMTKTGAGRVVFAGTTSLTPITVKAGTVRFTGNATSQVNLDGGTIEGTGSVGSIVSLGGGGTIAPGASPGKLTSGSVQLNSATTLQIEINGLSPITQYDQLQFFTASDLGQARLQVSCGFDPPIGFQYTIVPNSSAGMNQFADISNLGHVAAPGGIVFRVNYLANSILLTRVQVPLPTFRSPTLLSGPGIGERTMELNATGTPGLVYLLEGSTNLVDWVVLDTLRAEEDDGELDFAETLPINVPKRFYRTRLP